VQGQHVKRASLAVLVLLGLLAILWFAGGKDHFLPAGSSARKSTGTGLEAVGDDAAVLKFRSKERVEGRVHRPEQLVHFILPRVEIDGLALGPALDKLMAAYVDACGRSGQIPLAFTFDVPPDDGTRLRMTLAGRNFSNAVRMLAAGAGMQVSRSGLNYTFSPMADGGGPVAGKVVVSYDLMQRLMDLTGTTPEKREDGSIRLGGAEDLLRMLAAMGVKLDPSTKIALDHPSRELRIDAASPADFAKLEALSRMVDDAPAVQAKFTAKVAEIPAGFDATEIREGVYSGQELQRLLQVMSQNSGVNFTTMPLTMTKDGNPASIEISREVIYPVGNGFETRNTGMFLDFQGGALGFGQQAMVGYRNVIMDEHSGQPISAASFRSAADIRGEGYSDDGATRLLVQRREDGSRVLMFVTVDRIDPTGRLMRGGN